MWRLLKTGSQGHPLRSLGKSDTFTTKNFFTRRPVSPKAYSTNFSNPAAGPGPRPPPDSLPPVRILGPVLWTVTAVGTIFIGSAAYEIHNEAAAYRASRRGDVIPSLEALDASKDTHTPGSSFLNAVYYSSYATSVNGNTTTTTTTKSGDSLDPTTRLVLTLISANIALFAATAMVPRLGFHFLHTPVGPRNYTLLTSMFGHAGKLHLFLNMYGLFMFFPKMGQSPALANGSAPHLGAFYVSSGVIAGLGWHLAGAFPGSLARFMPALGASGAIYAGFAAYCATKPDARFTIIFLPFLDFSSTELLSSIAVFETLGLLGFLPFVTELAHAAHLTGLAVGVAYVHMNGKERVWGRARKIAFSGMKTFKMI